MGRIFGRHDGRADPGRGRWSGRGHERRRWRRRGGGQGPTTIRESILTLNVVGTSSADLALFGQAVRTAISGIIGASTAVGALQTQLSTQMSYNFALSDALTSGIGSLVDADMNVASTRLQALQIQQQLGIQALSIANQNGQLILRLFQAA